MFVYFFRRQKNEGQLYCQTQNYGSPDSLVLHSGHERLKVSNEIKYGRRIFGGTLISIKYMFTLHIQYAVLKQHQQVAHLAVEKDRKCT